MIAVLIGGMVVLCVGLLTVVFGIPVKEFSFGNTMILAGAVVSCTGLLLIGLYAVGREVRALARRLESRPGLAAPRELPLPPPASPLPDVAAPPAPPVFRPAPPRPQARHEDMLFSRDRLGRGTAHEESEDLPAPDLDQPLTEEPTPSWLDRPAAGAPAPAEPPEAAPARRPRRNIMFSSHRRELRAREETPREPPPVETAPDQPSEPPAAESFAPHEPEPAIDTSFDRMWPQPERSRAEPAAPSREAVETSRERFQPPRRAEAESVTIVKSGVVDSMAYSLYSDGSIEAQMPEGMVRFASIDELRAHLEQRG
jgi:hypothetical protein